MSRHKISDRFLEQSVDVCSSVSIQVTNNSNKLNTEQKILGRFYRAHFPVAHAQFYKAVFLILY
jgi:hypothetical protein